MIKIKFSKCYVGCGFDWRTDYFKEQTRTIFSTKRELLEYYGITDIKKVGSAFAIGNNSGYYTFPVYEGMATNNIIINQ